MTQVELWKSHYKYKHKLRFPIHLEQQWESLENKSIDNFILFFITTAVSASSRTVKGSIYSSSGGYARSLSDLMSHFKYYFPQGNLIELLKELNKSSNIYPLFCNDVQKLVLKYSFNGGGLIETCHKVLTKNKKDLRLNKLFEELNNG